MGPRETRWFWTRCCSREREQRMVDREAMRKRGWPLLCTKEPGFAGSKSAFVMVTLIAVIVVWAAPGCVLFHEFLCAAHDLDTHESLAGPNLLAADPADAEEECRQEWLEEHGRRVECMCAN